MGNDGRMGAMFVTRRSRFSKRASHAAWTTPGFSGRSKTARVSTCEADGSHPSIVDASELSAAPPRNELLSIIVPVFNESATVAHVLERLLAIDLPLERELIVVDDGSTDGTHEVLARYGERDCVRLLMSEQNAGKGRAVRLGLAAAHGAIVAIQDADLELDPADIALLATPILKGDASVVYGSRFLAGRPQAPWLTIAANGSSPAHEPVVRSDAD